jgi:hypothetical protein
MFQFHACRCSSALGARGRGTYMFALQLLRFVHPNLIFQSLIACSLVAVVVAFVVCKLLIVQVDDVRGNSKGK